MYEWCGDLFRSAMLILPTLLLGLLHCTSFMNIYVRSTLMFRHAACHSLTFDEYNIAFFKFCFLVCLPPAVPTALLFLLPLVLNETIDNKPKPLDVVPGLLVSPQSHNSFRHYYRLLLLLLLPTLRLRPQCILWSSPSLQTMQQLWSKTLLVTYIQLFQVSHVHLIASLRSRDAASRRRRPEVNSSYFANCACVCLKIAALRLDAAATSVNFTASSK